MFLSPHSKRPGQIGAELPRDSTIHGNTPLLYSVLRTFSIRHLFRTYNQLKFLLSIFSNDRILTLPKTHFRSLKFHLPFIQPASHSELSWAFHTCSQFHHKCRPVSKAQLSSLWKTTAWTLIWMSILIQLVMTTTCSR